MLENARRQLILVLLTIAASIACIAFLKPNLGQDLAGGTQILYDISEEKLKQDVKFSKTDTLDRLMDQTVSVIAERCDPTGTIGALVTRRGTTGILIELPALAKADLDVVKQRIESLGKLEMRIVASDDFSKDGVSFDLPEEKKRLQAWLADGGKELVKADANNIEQFNSLVDDKGPKAGAKNIRWYPHFVEPKLGNDSGLWSHSFAQSQLSNACVPVWEQKDYNNGVVPEALKNQKDKPRLLEFLAINMKEKFFTGEDLDPSGVQPTSGRDGLPAVGYALRGDKKGPYGDWSEEYIKKFSAIILNNAVKSAPVFESRIPGEGQIHGDFTAAEVDELVKVLRTGSLRVEPELQSSKTIGASLGDAAIHRGVVSMVAGTVAVFAFMLFYYRLSGLVACTTLLLNVLLMYAAVLFMQATITLPGLGGIVLTMGMAVDANVLIYERIREELKRGKDLLRATRAGFDRALVVILDCHVTTFITGLVLYNIGIGPVRGFAVTLMVGIVTTVFTQFFVTRLLFHWLLATKRLVEFRAREVLQNSNFNFVRWIKLATTMSIVVIAFGAIYACFVPRETLLGLDFTGGANLQMVLQQPKAADDVRKVLEGDKAFAKDFLNPAVNTVEAGEDGRSTRFNVRLKLTDSMRHRVEQERASWQQLRDEAREKGEKAPDKYEPPYVTGLKKIFEKELSPPAYSDAKVVAGVQGNVGQAFAQITLHFQAPVEVAAAQKLLTDAKLPHVTVADPEQTTAVESKNLFVQWDVLNTTREWELFERVRVSLAGLTDRGGRSISPSDPFPESEEIQGRMVGELRNDAIGAIILSWILVALYLRIRFHEYSFGIAAIVSLVHDVGATFAAVVVANHLGLVHAELDLNMIACFLTIIGYSVNDTIVVFDRIRENEQDLARAGGHMPLPDLINRSINQTLSRTILTSGVTMFCVLAQFLVNWGSGSDLESFAFAMVIGIITGTYSSVYIAAPILIWMRKHTAHAPSPPPQQPAVAAPVS